MIVALRGRAGRASSSASSPGSAPRSSSVGEPEPLGRGGGLKFAARAAAGVRPVFALNGDELLDVDLAALLARHRERRPAATIAVAPLRSPFGVVDSTATTSSTGFREAPKLPHWVSCGRLRARRRGDRAPAGARRPRDDDVPRARGRGEARRVPARGPLAHREHAEGAARGRGVRRGASRNWRGCAA